MVTSVVFRERRFRWVGSLNLGVVGIVQLYLYNNLVAIVKTEPRLFKFTLLILDYRN